MPTYIIKRKFKKTHFDYDKYTTAYRNINKKYRKEKNLLVFVLLLNKVKAQ